MVILMLIDGYIDGYWWLLMVIDLLMMIDGYSWIYWLDMDAYSWLYWMMILMVIGSVLAWFKLNGPRPLRRNHIAEIATWVVSRSKPVGEDVAGYLTPGKTCNVFPYIYIHTVYIYIYININVTHTHIITYIYIYIYSDGQSLRTYFGKKNLNITAFFTF